MAEDGKSSPSSAFSPLPSTFASERREGEFLKEPPRDLPPCINKKKQQEESEFHSKVISHVCLTFKAPAINFPTEKKGTEEEAAEL